MRKSHFQRVAMLTAVAAGTVFIPASPASACSPARCWPSSLLPLAGSLPSNALELLWHPATSQGTASTPTLHLYTVSGTQRTEVPFEVTALQGGLKRVRPTQPLAEGTELLVEVDEPACVVGPAPSATLTVGPAATQPSALGTLEVTSTRGATPRTLPTTRGSCVAPYRVAEAHFKLEPAAEAEPYVGSMRHALVIDGRAVPQRPLPVSPPGWPSTAIAAALEDSIFTYCGESPGASVPGETAGSHRVQWLATLPDGTELRSDEVVVELDCDADAPVADAGLSNAGAAGSDAESSESAPDPAGATTTASLPVDADERSAPSAIEDDGCSVTSARALPSSWLWLLAVTWLYRRMPRPGRPARRAAKRGEKA